MAFLDEEQTIPKRQLQAVSTCRCGAARHHCCIERARRCAHRLHRSTLPYEISIRSPFPGASQDPARLRRRCCKEAAVARGERERERETGEQPVLSNALKGSGAKPLATKAASYDLACLSGLLPLALSRLRHGFGVLSHLSFVKRRHAEKKRRSCQKRLRRNILRTSREQRRARATTTQTEFRHRGATPTKTVN